MVQELVSNERAWAHIRLGIAPVMSLYQIADSIQSALRSFSNEQLSSFSKDEAYKLAKQIYETIPNIKIVAYQEFYKSRRFSGLDLSRLLAKYQNHNCFDPRDKIYGLVGEAYLNGLINGEAISNGKFQEEEFEIV